MLAAPRGDRGSAARIPPSGFIGGRHARGVILVQFRIRWAAGKTDSPLAHVRHRRARACARHPRVCGALLLEGGRIGARGLAVIERMQHRPSSHEQSSRAQLCMGIAGPSRFSMRLFTAAPGHHKWVSIHGRLFASPIARCPRAGTWREPLPGSAFFLIDRHRIAARHIHSATSTIPTPPRCKPSLVGLSPDPCNRFGRMKNCNFVLVLQLGSVCFGIAVALDADLLVGDNGVLIALERSRTVRVQAVTDTLTVA